jgi:integrase
MGKRGNNEGSIYEDPRGFYRASLSVDGGKRKYFSGKTRKDVAKKLNTAIEAQDKGLPLPGERLTLEKYLADWLANTIKPGRRAGTHLLYETAVRLHVAPVIGKVPLAKVGPQHVQKLQAGMLAKGIGVKRIKLIRACLSAALTQAVRWNLLVRNPVSLVEPPHEEQEEPRPLTPEQAARLLSVARGHDFEQLYTVMLATGLRISEALGLRWFDVDRAELGGVDLEAKQLHVRQQITIIPGQPWTLTPPKSKSGKRSVPLIPVAIAALHAQRARGLELQVHAFPGTWQEHGFVFCDELGQPIVGRRVERVFKQHLQRAGLPTDFTPHSLRHSCGTWLTAQRVPDRVVMGILGHSSPSMTARYQHVMQSMVDDAADQLAAIFPPTTASA